ncbi:gp467 [Bacillus phage G]|uniref:Gp467 n=1 Tax=Bacillus phage G TaxID=2884420 RepID=G3MAK8_9CAUD|nr:gp467 [Bacillus phage G]AEO93725.1 gp467 [Bacillus phage G]
MLLDIKLRVSEIESVKELIAISDQINISKEEKNLYKMIATRGKNTIKVTIETNENKMIYSMKNEQPYAEKIHDIEEIVEYLYVNDNQELQSKLDAILCKNNLCPICNSELELDIYAVAEVISCKNKCYSVIDLTGRFKLYFHVVIFGENISASPHDKILNKVDTVNQLYDKINLWKDNDNYLTKMLMEGN